MRLRARLRDLSFELSGAQLGITITSLLLGAVAEPTVARVLEAPLGRLGITREGVIVGIALVVATLTQMVVGELFPKNVAIARPYPSSIRVGLPMAAVNALLRPLILLFNHSANWTVRRFGIEPRDELAGLRSLQELEMIVRASSEEGQLDETETTILTRAIAFVEKDAADAMIPRVSVVGVTADTTVRDVRDLANGTGHSRFPVYESDLDSVVGVVHVKDTFAVPEDAFDVVTAREVAQPAEFVPESMRLDSLLIVLQSEGRGMAIVIDEYGGTAGIVAVEDIIEEILGEIEDEHDVSAPPADLASGISGGLHRHEVLEATGFEWPEGAYETLNGFVTARLGRFPEVGDEIHDDGFTVRVTAVSERVAETLEVFESGQDPEVDSP